MNVKTRVKLLHQVCTPSPSNLTSKLQNIKQVLSSHHTRINIRTFWLLIVSN